MFAQACMLPGTLHVRHSGSLLGLVGRPVWKSTSPPSHFLFSFLGTSPAQLHSRNPENPTLGVPNGAASPVLQLCYILPQTLHCLTTQSQPRKQSMCGTGGRRDQKTHLLLGQTALGPLDALPPPTSIGTNAREILVQPHNHIAVHYSSVNS